MISLQCLLPASCLEIAVVPNKDAYTNKDDVTGHVVLSSESQVDIGSVSIKLSGTATSRVRSRRISESHLLFKTTQLLFPPTKCAGAFSTKGVTVPAGEHRFPFYIKLPGGTECYKNTTISSLKKQTKKRAHIIAKLPPSSGDRLSHEEIKYTLEATVRQDGLIRGTKKATKEIRFQNTTPISGLLIPGVRPSPNTQTTETKKLQVRLNSPGHRSPLNPSASSTYEITAKLLSGPTLVLGQPIPLAVEISEPAADPFQDPINIPISLHDFQSMILETTSVRARGVEESTNRSWVVQTVANLSRPFVSSAGDHPAFRMGRGFGLDDELWSRYPVPPFLSPTFETCCVARRYKLEVRLGFEFGGCQMKIVEFQFPVDIVSPDPNPTSTPTPDLCSRDSVSSASTGTSDLGVDEKAHAKELDLI